MSVTSSAAVAAATVSALRRAGVADVVLAPGSRSAALAVALYEADAAGSCACTSVSTSGPPGSSRSGWRRAPTFRSRSSAPPAPPWPTCTRRCSRPFTWVSGSSCCPPTDRRRCGVPAPTRRRSRRDIFGPRVPCVDVPPGDAVSAVAGIEDAVRRTGPSQLNLQFADPLLADGPAGEQARRAATSFAAVRRTRTRGDTWRSRTAPYDSPPGRARSSSQATTPVRPRDCSPRTGTGRCSPSRPRAQGPERTRSVPTDSCSVAISAAPSSASS